MAAYRKDIREYRKYVMLAGMAEYQCWDGDISSYGRYVAVARIYISDRHENQKKKKTMKKKDTSNLKVMFLIKK